MVIFIFFRIPLLEKDLKGMVLDTDFNASFKIKRLYYNSLQVILHYLDSISIYWDFHITVLSSHL